MMSLSVTAGAQMRSRTYRIPRPDYKKMGVLVLTPKESREERRLEREDRKMERKLLDVSRKEQRRARKEQEQQELRTGILWLHGGGYISGMKSMAKWVGRPKELVRKYGAVVVSPGYRLSFEHPYPAAIEDCYTALEWMVEHADELGIRSDQIFVGGESAGGGLAAALCILARDRGEIRIAYQMPLYPMLDDRDTESSRYNHNRVWDTPRNLALGAAVCGGRARDRLPRPAPLLHLRLQGRTLLQRDRDLLREPPQGRRGSGLRRVRGPLPRVRHLPARPPGVAPRGRQLRAALPLRTRALFRAAGAVKISPGGRKKFAAFRQKDVNL